MKGGKGHVQAANFSAPVAASAPGYWLVASDGGIFTYGGAGFAGSTGSLRLNRPIVGMTPTPTGNGYWMVASDGGVFTFGDAVFAGSTGAIALQAPIVGLASTPTGQGYWLMAADGGVFTFGDATYYGSAVSMTGVRSHGPVVGAVATPSGLGYWLVTTGGEVDSLGDAQFFGDASTTPLHRGITAIAPSPSGLGYWLVTLDGNVYAYGDARHHGQPGALPASQPIVALAASPAGNGYWMAAADGTVFSFGDAANLGSAGNVHLSAPVVGVAATPLHHGVGVAAFYYPWYANLAHDNQIRHWDQGGHAPPDDIGADYYPARGAYSSMDDAVLDAQMAEIADAGIDEIVSSWWGQGSYEDRALAPVMTAAAAHGVRVGIHLEPYVGRSIGTIGSDLAYLRARGLTDIWFYQADLLPAAGLALLNDRYPGDLHLAETGRLGSVRSGAFAAFAAAGHFVGIYSYDGAHFEGIDYTALCATARRVNLACAPATSPGFTAQRSGGGPFRSRAGGATYDRRWMGALGARPDIVAITSYNEWHEGTQIEPDAFKCLPGGFCYFNYDHAYGLDGPLSVSAYIGRTKSWTARYRSLSA